jgi:hypothetical protein
LRLKSIYNWLLLFSVGVSQATGNFAEKLPLLLSGIESIYASRR